jgi:glycosyltransferase 2 family protein
MKKYLRRIVLPLLVTAVILFFSLRRISVEELSQAFASLPFWAVGFFVVFSLLGTIVRAARYRLLLEKAIGPGEIFLITLVQNFSVDLLPARTAALGFYAYLIRRRGVILEEGASSFIVAVFYDALALGLMLGTAALFFMRSLGGAAPRGPLAAGLAVIVAVSLAFIFLARPAAGLARRTLTRFRSGRIAAQFASIENYFLKHGKVRERAALLGLSFLVKLAKYISLYALFAGMTGAGFALRSFSLFSFGIAGAELSSFLPIQGLAGFGTWEAAFALVAGKIGLPLENPFLTALAIHITTQVWEYGLGLTALWILSIQVRRRKWPAEE